MNCRIVEVFYAAGVCDAAGREVRRSIAELGVAGVEDVTVVNLYRIEGDLTDAAVRRIAREVLADRISQRFRIRTCGASRAAGRYAEVWLKPGVTDPVAETTVRAIRDIGVRADVRVATGVRYLFSGKVSRQTVDTICRSLLVNSLIHDYVVG